MVEEKDKIILFRSLAQKSFYIAGVGIGLDKKYSSASAVKATVSKIYNEVQQDPEKFSIPQDTIDLVVAAVNSRKSHQLSTKPRLAELIEKDKASFPELALSGRNKALSLVHAKLDRMSKSKKSLDGVAIGQLATVYGILFDKAQIIRGEVTERVMILSKNVNINMNPQEAIDMAIKMREIHSEEKVQ